MLQKMPDFNKKDHFNVNLNEQWDQAVIFLNTIKDKEFFDKKLTSKEILYRLFSQLEVKILNEMMVNCLYEL